MVYLQQHYISSANLPMPLPGRYLTQSALTAVILCHLSRKYTCISQIPSITNFHPSSTSTPSNKNC